MPSTGAWIRNSRLRTAAESISDGMQQARNEAVRRNQPVEFLPGLRWRRDVDDR